MVSEARKRATKNYKARQATRGNVQVHVYVPSEFRSKLVEFAKDLRRLKDGHQPK